MKKIISILLGVILTCTLLAFVGCKTPTPTPEEPTATYKFGAGVYNLAEEKRGAIEVASNAAAVILEDDKIIAVELDTAAYTNKDGETLTDLRTKGEKKDDYGMATAAKGNWYVQVEFFKGLVIGKTIDEVKALMASDGYGTDVVKAGCTILIDGFVGAIENAVKNAVEADVKGANIKVATFVEAKAGASDVYFAMAALKDGKIIINESDCVQTKFNTAVGEVLSKRQKGDNYGMASAPKGDWYKQADFFDGLCAGKTIAEVEALMATDGYGTDVVKAGCTIGITGMVGAIAKLA
ncbi:MAG: hypothetical protein E7342_04055 [Clostridiales bacterium]|nr:hypothetical protein [Clostridiales bacterium]